MTGVQTCALPICKPGKFEVVVALLDWKVYCDILLPFVKSTTLHEDIVRLILEVALMVSLQLYRSDLYLMTY